MAADGGASGAAAGLALYGWAAKLGALLGAGVIGALLMAAMDPAEAMPDPKKRRKLIFTQVVVAMVASTFFTKPTLRILDSMFEFIQLDGAPIDVYLEWALPVALLWGTLSWGGLGAMVKLRQIIADRGGLFIAKKAGIEAPGDAPQ